MKIKILNVNSEVSKKIFPGKIQGLIGLPTTIVFGVLEEENLLGVAVASMISPTTFCINHIRKVHDVDDSVYEMLLTNMESFFRDNGARSIIARIIESPEQLLEISGALKIAGFVPTTYNGHFIVYSFEHIVNTPFFENISSQGNIFNFFTKIKTYRQLSKQQLNDFAKKLKSSKHHGPTFNPDKKSSRYYISEGRVLGYMDASYDGEDNFFIRDIYIPISKEDNNVLPLLMASIFVEMNEVCDEKGTLVITLHRNDVYNWFKNFFGEYLLEQNIFEFMKVM